MLKKLTTKDVVTMAVLMALTIVLGRTLAIPTPVSRISFSFLPIAVAGMLVGPVWAGVMAFLADLVGTQINAFGGVYFPLFGISDFCYGFIYGLFFYQKEINWKRILCCLLATLTFYFTVGVATQYLYWSMFMHQPRAVGGIIQVRAWSSLVNYPVRFVVIYFVNVYLRQHVKAFTR
ncbi:MAG TPA: folate family ECF transporter S component [Candidatus Avimonoglobus intestinipullorum]|uniref:Folate family ECF transporter S component n=1 Tax=Candidatus Avimonoglobus intestinipullorum TaxID=2840699 RepID=A0A9D1S5C5_9FIRM|nr:folate family ECF transporter S component [Candidatus Avimonoglobus intestinipullorum]